MGATLRRGVVLASGLALWFCAAASAAEPAASETTPPPIVAPVPASPLVAEYPEGAQGEATVTLVVVVGADGGVRSAKASAGASPFAEAAERAARTFRFAPAMRGGVAIAATIRLEIRFSPPVAPVDEPASPPAPIAAGADAASPPEPVEIEVRGARAARPGVLARAEVRQLPGAFGDPFRAIEVLPGVTPMFSGLPYAFVRGAPPLSVGYLVDGVRVPVLFHFVAGPAVVHPAIVESVTLSPGVYPSEIGRHVGGVVSAETTAPLPTLHGEANLRLLDVGAFVERDVGERVTVAGGGRYAWGGPILSRIAGNVEVSYADYLARGVVRDGAHDTTTVLVLGSRDLLADSSGERPRTLLGVEFHRLAVRHAHDLGDLGKLRVGVHGGFDRALFDENGESSRASMVGAVVEASLRPSSRLELRVGTDVELSRSVTSKEWNDDGLTYLLRRDVRDTVAGVWIDPTVEVARGFSISPGARADLFVRADQAAPRVEPRVRARIDVADGVRLLPAFGMAHELPPVFIPIPGYLRPDLGGPSASTQTSLGVEADLDAASTAGLTGFFHTLADVPDFVSSRDLSGTGHGEAPRASGRTYGLEASYRHRLTRRVGGLASYTLSRSMRTVDGHTSLSRFDRTHVFNGALTVAVGRGWTLGSRVLFYTGVPLYLAADAGATTLTLADPSRTPPFVRVDLRAEKRWPLGPDAWISFVVDVLNASVGTERLPDTCSSTQCTTMPMGPVVIPSLGAEAGF